MDYRRNEGFIRQSPSSSRLHDPYENMDRSVGSHRLVRRSVSPQGMPQDVGVSQRTGSDERKEFGWTVDRGRVGWVRSRSPPGDARKRLQYDNGVRISPGNYSPTPLVELRQRRGEMGEPKNVNFNSDDAEFHAMHAYGYDPSDLRTSKEEFNDMSFSAGDEHQLLGQDSVPAKVLAQGSYRSPSHLGTAATPVYGVTGGKLPPFSRPMDTQQHFEQGRVQYHDAMPTASNRLQVTHSYKDGEKPMFQTRDVTYQMIRGSNSKGFLNSSEMSRHEYLAYQDGLYLPQINEFRSSSKNSEPTALVAHRERSLLDSARDPEGSQRNASFYMREYSPDKGERENYFYLKSREMVDDRGYLGDDRGYPADDRGYPADDMHKIVVAPRAQRDYGRTQIIYDHRDMPRPTTTTHSVVDINDNIDGSGGNLRRGIKYYHPVEKQTDADYLDMRRTPHAPKQGGEYLGSRFAQVQTRSVPEDHELLHVGAPKDHRISDLEAEYLYEGNLGRQFQEQRSLHSPVSKYETEMNRNNVRMQNMRDGRRIIYKPQDRVIKGKYSLQEDTRSYNPRKTFPGKMYSIGQFDESHETREEWIDEEMSEVYASRTRGFQQSGYRRTERNNKYGGLEDHGDFVCDEWLLSQELPHARKHSVGFHKPYSRPIKGNRRPPSYATSHHNSKQHERKDHLYQQRNNYDRRNQLYRQNNYYDRKNHVYRQHKIWKTNEGYRQDMIADDGNNESDHPSEDWVGREESVLTEDSDEFKQLVHEAFLKYSRILSVNSGVQRRYKEEGKAGSLFCIVCGRSASKEFMDTRRLVTHAFMSHKTGLRADHLGLHKAICVLLGWSTVIPEETITWVPQVLPQPQALAQKEDLILWPPVVVIHNVSLSDRNPENWKVITMEELETFIRGKGFLRGRIKVVLGKPADQSVMVVKFLGTFTGLGDAEKLHKYFAESKRGRTDLEEAAAATTLNGGKIVVGVDKEEEAEKAEEEKILYGYMGISEDLDRVDYNTRNTGLVKSKIDILDLANAPVKTEETAVKIIEKED